MDKRTALTAIAALSLATVTFGQIPKTQSPAGAKVYFIEPKDGAVITGPIKVVMGLSGMGVAPAGTDAPDTGHHHIFVDVGAVNPDTPIPVDDQHRHFGKGQTEATLTLPPGTHTLQLVFGDRNHIPHSPPVVSEKITITVK
jgi:hypothetical protein